MVQQPDEIDPAKRPTPTSVPVDDAVKHGGKAARHSGRGRRYRGGPLLLFFFILASVGLVQWRSIWRTIRVFDGAAPAKSQVAWINNMHTAMLRAKEQHRLILADFHADWCLPCRRMQREVWTSPRVGTLVAASFIPLSVDVDTQEGKLLSHNFMVNLLPSVLVINTHGEVLTAGNFMDKSQMLAFLRQAAGRTPAGKPSWHP